MRVRQRLRRFAFDCRSRFCGRPCWNSSSRTRTRQPSPSTGVDRHGFRFDADHMFPAFWSKGPFLVFLRHNWRPALDLVIRLTNFATDRYEEWWPYQPGVAEVSITTPQGNCHWKGNHQVYAWNRYHMNTPQVVTCALLFDEAFRLRIELRGGYRNLEALALSLAVARRG